MQTRILVVDDDPHIRELLRFYFQQERYIVIEAKDGEEASDLLETEQIHLAVVDVMMPKRMAGNFARKFESIMIFPSFY